jgi:hypothetical protein
MLMERRPLNGDAGANLLAPAPGSLQSLLQTEQLLNMTPHPLRHPNEIASRKRGVDECKEL